MNEAIDRHFSVRNYYTVTLSVLLGAYVAGLLQLATMKICATEWWLLSIALLMLPIITLILSGFAIESTTRYYTVFLRMVALVAKIENMLGLDGQVKGDGTVLESKPLWNEDKAFMDEDYLTSRLRYESSGKFIKAEKMKGDNKWSTLTFVVFALASAVFLGGHIGRLFAVMN